MPGVNFVGGPRNKNETQSKIDPFPQNTNEYMVKDNSGINTVGRPTKKIEMQPQTIYSEVELNNGSMGPQIVTRPSTAILTGSITNPYLGILLPVILTDIAIMFILYLLTCLIKGDKDKGKEETVSDQHNDIIIEIDTKQTEGTKTAVGDCHKRKPELNTKSSSKEEDKNDHG